jgi:hypothetical protein
MRDARMDAFIVFPELNMRGKIEVQPGGKTFGLLALAPGSGF